MSSPSSSHEWLSNWEMVFMYKHAWWCWFGEGQSMYLSFLLHAQFKTKHKTVCLCWILFSFQHKQSWCCTFKNGGNSSLIFTPSHPMCVRVNIKISIICSRQDGPTVVFLPSYQNTWLCNIYNIFKFSLLIVVWFNCRSVNHSFMV